MSSYNFFNIVFFTYMKMSKDLLAEYYQNNKERLEKKVPERYQSVSRNEKETKRQYGCKWCKNLPEDFSSSGSIFSWNQFIYNSSYKIKINSPILIKYKWSDSSKMVITTHIIYT